MIGLNRILFPVDLSKQCGEAVPFVIAIGCKIPLAAACPCALEIIAVIRLTKQHRPFPRNCRRREDWPSQRQHPELCARILLSGDAPPMG